MNKYLKSNRGIFWNIKNIFSKIPNREEGVIIDGQTVPGKNRNFGNWPLPTPTITVRKVIDQMK